MRSVRRNYQTAHTAKVYESTNLTTLREIARRPLIFLKLRKLYLLFDNLIENAQDLNIF